MYNVKTKNNKVIAEIHFLTDKKGIRNKQVINIIEKALVKCYSEIPLLNKKIAVFSTNDPFIKNRMGGVGGYALEEKVITISINPIKGWEKELEKCIAHEDSHLYVSNNNQWKTILDSLISEGIAEVFREEIVGGKPAPWTKALTEKQAKEVLKKLKSKRKLGKKVEEMHQELFLGSKDYKMWTGYSLGYQIVKKFRKKYPEMKWKEIMKMDFKELFRKSDF